jgi:hypothetical protein
LRTHKTTELGPIRDRDTNRQFQFHECTDLHRGVKDAEGQPAENPRTTECRARAVAAGVRMGRRPKLNPTQDAHAREMRGAGKSVQEIGDVLGVSHMTVCGHTDRVGQSMGQ